MSRPQARVRIPADCLAEVVAVANRLGISTTQALHVIVREYGRLSSVIDCTQCFMEQYHGVEKFCSEHQPK